MENAIPLHTWLIRLLLAVVLGGIVGFERQFHGRPAGLRTHILVCLGAALITLSGMMLAGGHLTESGVIKIDPARIAAGVITGIGFLGAGAIIRTGDMVRGLTTAACIWFTAGLGVIIGFGFTAIALAATAIEIATLVGLVYLEAWIPPFYYRDVLVVATGVDPDRLEESCRKVLSGHKIRITEIEADVSREPAQVRIVFHLLLQGAGLRGEVLRKLGALEGVRQISWKRHQEKM